MNRFTKLIPELAEWNESSGILLSDWVGMVGRFDHFLGYIELSWPSFIVVDDRVYIESMFDEDVYNRFFSTPKESIPLQKRFNCLSIADLFLNAQEERDPNKLLHIANSLMDSWTTKLNKEFPEREFHIVLENDEDDPEDWELNLSFFET